MKGNTGMSYLPAAIRESFVDTSRLRARVLESGPPGAPTLVLVHGNVSSARFFAETMVTLGAHGVHEWRGEGDGADLAAVTARQVGRADPLRPAVVVSLRLTSPERSEPKRRTSERRKLEL